MAMTDEQKAMVSLLKKKSELRSRIHGMNWDKDKAMIFNNKKQYDYLSFEKICKQIAPEFESVGLEFTASDLELSAEAPVGSMAQHWVVKTEFTIWDVDTGASQAACSYGEAADSGDKGVNKAKTCALKRWFLDTFQLTEGGEDLDDYSPSAGASTVLNPKPSAGASTVLNSSTAAKEPQAAKQLAPAQAESKPYEPTLPQKKAIENIMNRYREKADKGEVDESVFKRMAEDCANIKAAKDVVDFITKYRV